MVTHYRDKFLLRYERDLQCRWYSFTKVETRIANTFVFRESGKAGPLDCNPAETLAIGLDIVSLIPRVGETRMAFTALPDSPIQ